ncbi:MAG: NADH:ubiquinone reductase (Na(+)-transporting) subunit C [Mucinivorans sp.]
MNKNSNIYIIVYSTILVVVVAAVLAYASISLKPMQEANIRVEKMGAILASIGQGKDVATSPLGKDKYIEEEYAKYIVSSFSVDPQGNKVDGEDAFKALNNIKAVFAAKKAFPVFEARKDDGKTLYVFPLSGAGLWGPVWGYLALNDDCNTVYGAIFDHKSETPGLGAEIATPAFSASFVGKKLFDGDQFRPVQLTKGVGSSIDNPYAVDGISGGTLTSNGVSAMLKTCLGDYLPFMEKVRAARAVIDTSSMMVVDSMAVASGDSVVPMTKLTPAQKIK